MVLKVSGVNLSLEYMVRLVFRLTSGEHILACNTARWTKETPICKLCDVYIRLSSMWYFRFDYINVSLGVVQEELFRHMHSIKPSPTQRYFTNFNNKHDKEKACFLLSGMKNNFTQE